MNDSEGVKERIDCIDDQQEEGSFEVKIVIENKNKPLDTPIELFRILEEKRFSQIRLEVLRNLAMLGDYFPQINFLLASKGKGQLFFDSEEFVDILFKILPTIQPQLYGFGKFFIFKIYKPFY